MLNFLDDYSSGAHEKVLEALTNAGKIELAAYGNDEITTRVAQQLVGQLERDCEIFFVSTGTTANLVMIAGSLRGHEAVISPETGHINLYEAGAIEAAGHRIIACPTEDGKLSHNDLKQVIQEQSQLTNSASKPGLVYISNTTETGLVYTASELEQLSLFCRNHDLLLMMDGARLGYALSSKTNDLSLARIAELVDLFWMGGTKVGGLMGETLVFCKSGLADGFPFHLKQRGALLSKSWAVSAQFEALLKNDLMIKNAKHANQMASGLAEGLVQAGWELYYPAESNQVFAKISLKKLGEIKQSASFFMMEDLGDGNGLARFVTSWATSRSDVDTLIGLL